MNKFDLPNLADMPSMPTLRASSMGMSAVLDELFAALAPKLGDVDAGPQEPAFMCAITVGVQQMQGALARHPSVPGMMRLMAVVEQQRGEMMVETYFLASDIKSIAVPRPDVQVPAKLFTPKR